MLPLRKTKQRILGDISLLLSKPVTQQLSQSKQLDFLESAELHEIELVTGHLECTLTSTFLCYLVTSHASMLSFNTFS